jgi:hypothetical protein
MPMGPDPLLHARRPVSDHTGATALLGSLPRVDWLPADLRKAGKPHKVIITAVARKLVTSVTALCRNRQKWTAPTN